jgi:cobalamin biosynthetic protein CobC
MKHGGDLTAALAQYGGAPQDWQDLSTGINPWPWPVPAHLPQEVWTRLPSRADEDVLRAAARDAYGVPDGIDVVAAPGTQALIQWLPQLAASGAVAIVGPTYNEHAIAWRNAGRDVIAIADIGDVPAEASHVVVVNPNNPDGRIADAAVLAEVAARMRARNGWLVIDEAFADVDPAISAVALCKDLPVITLRSFGKFYGLAGLRLGFAIAHPAIAQRIAEALGPWACSGPALHIGAAALRDRVWADGTRVLLQQQAARLDKVLVETGLNIVGGTSLFRLAQHVDAAGLHDKLARRHIWCRSFDFADDLLRFGLPDAAGLGRLATALAK